MSSTEQFWKGEFGDTYTERNEESPVGSVESNIHFFRKALDRTIPRGGIRYEKGIEQFQTAVEFGAGTGRNIVAIDRVCSGRVSFTAVEINPAALERLTSVCGNVIAQSFLDYDCPYQHDLAFTKGVLIHTAPEDLPRAYAALFKASRRYVLVCEYYCPSPRMIPYRGHNDRLWARDFAGEMMRAHPLKLLDYGFVSKYDEHPQDDLSWFLMEKK